MRRLHDLWRRGRRAARITVPDSELLDRFVRAGDHAAFAELVDRLGPLVYGACRRLLPNPADVEDAFQAAFLVLVRRADTLAGRSVGPWLHRVAVWTARNFRRRNAASATRPIDGSSLPGSPPGDAATDARLDIDAAVSALPEKYRVAVVLCHLQGWTRRELAAHLGCPESTASSLVGRGLAKLRKRLAGGDPAMVLAVAGTAAVPTGLAASAVRTAGLYRTSSLAAAASPAVAELTEGVLRMFRMKKLAAGLAAAVAVVGMGIGLTLGDGPRAEAQAPQPAAPAGNAKAQRDKIDQEIESAKERVKQLEQQRANLARQEREEALREYMRQRTMEGRVAQGEPHIGLWVRPQNRPRPAPTQNQNQAQQELEELYREIEMVRPGRAPRSEFAINEIYGKGKVVEAHFYDVGSLQTYLTRAAKDPTAPKKLKLYIDKEYPAAKVKPVLDACKAAGFKTIELVSAPAGKATLPAYVIEAPDVLTIEAVLRSGDKLRMLPTQPISGQFLVRPDGTVGLGVWGSMNVTGLTIDKATEAIRKHLLGHELLKEYAVRPESLVAVVDVLAYNSKSYYVITDEGKGESVHRFALTGNVTIRDALSQITGLTDRAAAFRVWLARPAADGQPDQTLPVNWAAIALEGVTTTNYQLLPGDRVYVKPKKEAAGR